MFPYTFEVVTAITLAVIGVILVLYYLVLKRAGWLTNGSSESKSSNKSFYRCPNQDCRKVFEKPIEVRDLSHTSPKIHSACPHCGFNLTGSSEFPVKKKKTLETQESPAVPVQNLKSEKPDKAIETLSRAFEEPRIAKNDHELLLPPNKSVQTKPPGCSHFFGYLKEMPKNTSIPEQCYGCPKMVDCITVPS